MTKVTHQFRSTKLQLWPVINVAECLTELRHDKNRNCPTDSTLCKNIIICEMCDKFKCARGISKLCLFNLF